jgi:D-alanine-D-alanine ligase-like ATP-grasp enzyme
MRYPFVSKLLEEIAPSMGIGVELEPEYQFVGELIFPDGKRHLFRNTNFNLNPAASTEIAKDKGYTSYFLRKHGFRTPKNKTFFSDKLNANLSKDNRRSISDAIEYAQLIGYPVFIKPNNLSQGTLVTKVYTPEEIVSVAEQIFERTHVLLLEEACPGNDYRLVVLGEEIISAYERVPLGVTGDGVHTIEELLEIAKNKLGAQNRPNSEINPFDPRIDLKLARLLLERDSILPQGQKIFLLDNANLSTGGTSVDVTDKIHPTFAAIAIAATRALGLRLAGIDILCHDLATNAADQVWNIIEVNAAPGLDNYASIGDEQAQRVKWLYRRILEYLAVLET